jgi:hypothetical protein
VEIVQHSTDVRRSFGTIVLKDPEVVVAIGEIVAIVHRRENFQSEGIAPKSDSLFQIGGTDTDMYEG